MFPDYRNIFDTIFVGIIPAAMAKLGPNIIGGGT